MASTAEVIDVTDENVCLARARLRTEMRELDAQIEKIRAEDRLFRRYGFGSDLHEIQLSALEARRRDLLASLARTGDPFASRKPRSSRLGAWLLVPPALAAMVVRSIFPRRGDSPRLA